MAEDWQRTVGRALVVAVALALSGGQGCSRKSEEPKAEEPKAGEPTVKETGKDISKNPFQAIQQFGEAAQKAGEKMQQAANRPPVEPLSLDQLTPFIGDIDGWTGEKPEGSKTQMGEWKVTVVSRTYVQTAAENAPRVSVSITDGGFVPAIYAPFHMMSQFSQETLDGYQKGLSVDGFPAFENWRKEQKSTDLTVLVADRYLVNVKSEGLEPNALHDWLANVRLKELAELK